MGFFMNDYQQEVVLFIFGDLILFDIKIKIKSWKYHVYRMFLRKCFFGIHYWLIILVLMKFLLKICVLDIFNENFCSFIPQFVFTN